MRKKINEMNKLILLIYFSITILFPILFTSCRKQIQITDTLTETLKVFSNPPADFRPAPLWVWNDLMTVDTIREQLVDFKDKGFGGVFVHPRPGLVTPYLSEEWLSLFKETVNLGKVLGLKIWIYDENSYPSGFAGGLVPAALPDAARSGLRATRVMRPEIRDTQNLICILQEENAGFVDITDRVRAGEKAWREGNYWLLEVVHQKPSPWYGGFTYVDLMTPGVTQAFLHLTHEAYKQVCGDEFGLTVPGTFQDEAEIAPAGGTWAVNYTPGLFTEFSQRRGYELRTESPSLLLEKGDFRRVRHDFYLTCLELFIENWARPYYDYCQKNNLQLTGHYWEHDWPVPRTAPDSMALNSYAHMPGIDILMNDWRLDPHAQFGNSRAVRELRSVANQLGRKRTLSETYGASGWDLTFFDQKRIGDWEYALGVNFLNQHLAYLTIAGARKRDHPLSFSYHEPWWHAYGLMNDYFGRLSVVLSSGEQVNRILVIEPTTSAWMYFSPAEKNEQFEKIGCDFQNFVHELERQQVEYDLGSEFIIKDYGKVAGGKLRVGHRFYNLVILPPGTENLEPSTARLLKNFLKAGGKILSWAESQLFVGGQLSSLAEELKSSGKFKSVSGQPLDEALISKNLKPEIEFEDLNNGQMLFHHRREFKDGQLLFLANVSPDKVASGQVKLRGKSVEKWDAFSGQIEAYNSKKKGRRLYLQFSLKPGESLLLAVYYKESARESFGSEKGEAEEEIVYSEPLRVQRLDPNLLTIDYCDLALDSRKEKNLYFYQAQKKTYNFHGFEQNPWDSAVQYQDSIISRNTFNLGTGFKARFSFTVASGVDRKSLKLVVERPEIFIVQVNGRTIEPLPNSWWLDKAFGVFSLERVIRTGLNTVDLIVNPFELLAELEPIYILGDFSLIPAAQGFVITPERPLSAGSWKSQGLPFYGHRVQYSTSIEINEDETEQSEFIIGPGRWNGALAELEVNGQQVGYFLGPEDCLVITRNLKPGKNDLRLIIYGTLKNTLGPHHLNPPPGMAWPGSFQKAPEGGQPSGTEYNVMDYGLFGNIVIKKIKMRTQE